MLQNPLIIENLHKSENDWNRLRAKARDRAFKNRADALLARGNRQSELLEVERLMRENRSANGFA